jgi:integrase
MPWPPDLVENLETYLQTYRPRFPNAAKDPHLFLTVKGLPISSGAIWSRFRIAIYQATKKRIWPHLLRQIWSDAYLDKHPGDYEGVAAMLNNTPEMVQKSYRRFRREQHLQKAVDFNAELFNGHPKRKTP